MYRSTRPSPSEYLSLIEEAKSLLVKERKEGGFGGGDVKGGLVVLEPKGTLIVVGDLHGDLESLVYVLKESKFKERAEGGARVIFLGDYVDRGEASPQTLHAILNLKVDFPGEVVLLRGNHEGPKGLQAVPHDLPYLLKAEYGGVGEEIYREAEELFDSLPHAALVEGALLLLHGGPPTNLSSMEELALARETYPTTSFLEEILWNDPVEGLGAYPSPRGAGKLFGEDVTDNALKISGAKALVRGHEPREEGFGVNHHGKVLTLFSRLGPPYFNSAASYLEVELERGVESAADLLRGLKKFSYGEVGGGA